MRARVDGVSRSGASDALALARVQNVICFAKSASHCVFTSSQPGRLLASCKTLAIQPLAFRARLSRHIEVEH